MRSASRFKILVLELSVELVHVHDLDGSILYGVLFCTAAV